MTRQRGECFFFMDLTACWTHPFYGQIYPFLAVWTFGIHIFVRPFINEQIKITADQRDEV
jgi:hypothetical protein